MRLPSLNALRAFESAARHESFARAALELHVSEGAVSRHIRLLEEELGLPLFYRRPRKVELTAHGESLLPVLSKAFKAIATGVRQVAGEGHALKIISQPSFSIRWLIPKLRDFRAIHPEIPVHVTTESHDRADLSGGGYDLAFGCGPLAPDGWHAEKITPAAMTPVCAPHLPHRAALNSAADLSRFNLLHSTTDRHDWLVWLARFGSPDDDAGQGETFQTLDMAMQAAVLGQGVAIGDLTLLGAELAAGTLICPLPGLVYRSEDEDYFVYGPLEVWDTPRVKAFRQWLRTPPSDLSPSETAKKVGENLSF
ncbi:transcriptional regulator GcvA [soil metagenome]